MNRCRSALLFILLAFVGCGEESYEIEAERVRADLLYDLVEEFPHVGLPAHDAGPRVDVELSSLHIPRAQRVDFYLRIPNGHALTLDFLSARGEAKPALRVAFQRSGGPSWDLGRLEPSATPVALRLPDGESPIGRLSLIAEGPESAGGSLGLGTPRVRAYSPVKYPDRSATRQTREHGTGPNVIVYLLDTLRVDHLGAYDYDRSISPHIDAFASEAVVFDSAIAQSPWTRASVASIFTGLEPHRHGVNGFENKLPGPALTLAELLSSAGYETAAFITNHNVGGEFGFEQGFDEFSVAPHRRARGSARLNERLFAFLRSREPDGPLFLYVHAMDPHAPYAPPESFRSAWAKDVVQKDLGELKNLRKIRKSLKPEDPLVEQIVSLYDAEIAFNDSTFGKLIEELKRLGQYESSLIIFVADHGEEFWDHGVLGHGHTLYSELLHVPLIIKGPGKLTEGRRVSDLVQHIDLFSTILDWAGVDIPPTEGRSLRRTQSSHGIGAPRSVYSKLDLRGIRGVSVTESDWKLIIPQSEELGTEPLLFDRNADRGEKRNYFGERPIIEGYLMSLLRAHERSGEGSVEPETATIDEELLERLKSLGYLE